MIGILKALFQTLDFHRTLLQCHVWQNLPFFCEKIYFEGHMGLFQELILATSGATLFLTLNLLVARACIFLWWIETEFLFFYKQILKSRSWNHFTSYSWRCIGYRIYFNIPLPWNIQVNRQYRYCDVTNAFITIFPFSRDIYGATFLCVEFLPSIFR